MKLEFLETIKSIDGVVQNVLYHQKRYESVLRHFGSCEFLELKTKLKPPNDGLYRCRVVYTLDGIKEIGYIKYEKRVINSLKLVEANGIEYSFKYADRGVLDALFAKREACDDVLIVKNDLISDTTIANVAFFDGELWLTPKKPLLAGTSRQRYLDMKKIYEADIKVDELGKFSKVALLNAMVDFDIIEKKLEDVIC